MRPDRRRAALTTMWRTRLLVGLLSFCQGASGALFHDGSIIRIISKDSYGALWGYGLMVCGALMIISAVAERLGETKRWCREFSVSMVGAMWLALFFEGIEDHAWTIVLHAPIYFGFCAWSYWSEAHAARATASTSRATETGGHHVSRG